MSSIFDIHDRIRRLREAFSYFRDATTLTSADLTQAIAARADPAAQQEWSQLLSEVREYLAGASALGTGPQSDAAVLRKPSVKRKRMVKAAAKFVAPMATVH